MAKRFTDTEKWADPWFSGLPLKMRLVWICLCDICDSVGVWKVNPPMLSFYVGETVTAEDLKMLGRRLVWIDDEKVWLPGFIPFQYGNLSNKNRAHLGIMRKVISLTANLPLNEPNRALIDSFKALTEGQPTLQVKEEVKVKEEDKDSLRGGVGEIYKPDLDLIYARYPRKDGKSRGLAILKASIKTPADFVRCDMSLDHFLDHLRRSGTEAQFIPHFKTWAAHWRDWLDPNHGKSESFAGSAAGLSQAEMDVFKDGVA